ISAGGPRRKSICHLFQVRNEREMTVVLGMVQSVANQERRWCIEADEPKLRARLGGQLLVEKGAYRQAARLPLAQQHHQLLQSLPSINNILDQEDMFPLEPGLGTVDQADR